MRHPAIRTRHARHEQQRVGEHRRHGGGRKRCDRQHGRLPRHVGKPHGRPEHGVKGDAECGIRDASEQPRPRRLNDADLGQLPSLRPPALGKHEKRRIETNSAQHRNEYPHLVSFRLNQIVRRLAALALLAASFALAGFVIAKQPYVEHLLRSLGPFAMLLAIAIFAVVAAAPFSVTDALAIMNGAIFGPIQGSIVNTIGLFIAALLGYAINVHASRMMDVDSYLARLPGWVRRFPVGSPLFLLAVRVIPGFGGTVATATAAAFRVPIWVHVWTMCAIAVPICTLLAIFGDRVTVFVHQEEHRARVYYESHHPHFRFHRHPKATPTP
jgi:uncharacterized membrane protein YdjX (TVP38/TMEM64 family)